jgi:two-component system sensor histidine kinase YesM
MKRNTLLRRVFLLVSGLFFGLLTITIVILSVFFSNLLIGNAEDYLRLIMQQNQRIVNTALARVDEVVVGLNNDAFIYEQVAAPLRSNVDHAISRQEISRYLTRSVYVPLRRSFRQVNYWLFLNDAYPHSALYATYSFPANRVLTMAQARQMPFYATTQQAQGQVRWFMQADTPQKIYAAVLIRGTFSAVTIPDIGILLLEFDVADVLGTAQRAGSDQSVYYMVNPQGEMFAVQQGTAPAAIAQLDAVLRTRGLLANRTMAYQTSRTDTDLYSVLLLDSGWWLVGVTPIAAITTQVYRLSEFVIPLLVVSIVAVLLVSYMIARSVVQPIAQLATTMQQTTQQSDLDLVMPLRPQTIEIAHLYDAYHAFVVRIKQLLRDVYLTGISVKQAEIRALQAQINPHFLYNTLDSISWVALDHGDADVPRVVSSLSNILRYSINDSDKLVPFSEELRIVRDYLAIQNFCYQLDIQLHVATDGDDEAACWPKLTLQPIIENALIHGVLEQKQKTGVIAIRLYRTSTQLRCEIENPGTADVVAMNALLCDVSEPQKHGIRNVHNRLRMLFGNESGLHFFTTPAGATVAVLVITHADE